MSVGACGKKKESLETNEVVHDLILGVDDEDALGGPVSPDKRMKTALLRNQRCQSVGFEKYWRRARAGARAGP